VLDPINLNPPPWFTCGLFSQGAANFPNQSRILPKD